MKQETALEILKTGKNVFLTGSAGAGKTYLLNQYIDYLRFHGVPLSITASTGIAATHIGGLTIHSWSGLGIKEHITKHDLQKMHKKKPLRTRIEKVKVLIIDEISMLSKETIGCIDLILQYFKKNAEPFGGIQVIFSGDFFQLPPVSRERKKSSEKFAFMAPVWVQANLNICYLSESYRHEENILMHVLDDIRRGEISAKSKDLLTQKLQENQEILDSSKIKLFTHNADVDRINNIELAKLENKSKIFRAETHGTTKLITTLKKSVLAPDKLELKKNAQVIFVRNNYEEGYVNGTMGEVIDFDIKGYPIVQTFDGHEITARPEEWQIEDELHNPIASFEQIPLRLAWAITVHKSQGMTLDAAEIDLSKTFEPGQGYVALSRIKTWQGLTLLGCNSQALLMDGLAMRADGRFQALSSEAEKAFQELGLDEHKKRSDQFILDCGGTLDREEIMRNKEIQQIPKKVPKKAAKISTYDQTIALIEKGKDLQDIADTRSLSIESIIKHLSKISKSHPHLDISLLKPEDERVDAVEAAIEKCSIDAQEDDYDIHGNIKLGLIHRELKRKFEFSEISLCRIFIKS